MASTGAIRAGRAFVEIFADKTALVRDLKSVSNDLRTLGSGVTAIGTRMAALGAGITAPLLLASRQFAAFGSTLYDMAARTGMSVEALSELSHAAEESGTALTNAETGIKFLQRAIVAAAAGGEGADLFRKIGISLSELVKLKPDQQFALIGEKIAAITDPTARAAVALKLFGRGGTSILPMLANMAALREEARRLGFTMGTEDAKAADELADAMHRQHTAVRSLSNAVGTALAPMLTKTANAVVAMIGHVRDWIKANPQLVQQVFKIGAGLTVAGAGLVAFGTGMIVVSKFFSAGAVIGKTFGAAIGLISSVLGLCLNPVVLLGAGLVGLVAYFAYTSESARKAASWIGDAFSGLVTEVTSALGTIMESMAAGDFASAAAVGWALVKLEWTKGVNFLETTWEGFKGFWSDAVSGIAMAFNNMAASIKIIWAEVLGWLQKRFVDSMVLFNEVMGPVLRAAGIDVNAGAIRHVYGSDAEIDAATKAKQKQIEKDRRDAEDVIGSDVAQRAKDRAAKAAAGQADVDAARRALAEAQAAAKAKSDAAKAVGIGQLPPGLDFDFAGAGKGKSSGTFSGIGLAQQFGSGSRTVDRIAKATEKTHERITHLAASVDTVLNQFLRISLDLQP